MKSKLKWHYITLLLTFIQFSNTFTTGKKSASMGPFARVTSFFFLSFDKA